MYQVELRYEIIRKHKLIFESIDMLDKLPLKYQFRSVYGYPQKVVDECLLLQSTRSINEYNLYSDTLFIDIDGSYKEVEQVKIILDKLNASYSVWDTGNRGAHIHVNIVPMSGNNIPYSQLLWMRDNFAGIEFDETIYKPTGQIRLPGAIHAKTGKVKIMTENILGYPINIVKSRRCPPANVKVQKNKQTTVELYIANLTRKRGSGQRHQHIMMITKDGISCGFDIDRILKDVLLWNSKWTYEPLSEDDVVNHVYKCYRQFGGK